MENRVSTQRIIIKIQEDFYLPIWLEAFVKDRKAQGLSEKSIKFHQVKLKAFLNYCESQLINQVTEITPETIRDYLILLQGTGHNQGGCYAALRSI